jgi:DNA-binding response OmpR family regulator
LDEALPVVLVIEDDQELQTILEDALRDSGFDPAIAGSGEEAITLRGFRSRYRALVTDIILLGRIDGWRVARVAREIDPTFPVVYVSGAAHDQWPVQGVPNSILLTKPFAPAQLVTAISQLLNIGTVGGFNSTNSDRGPAKA